MLGTDPGFLVGGGADPPGGPTYDFVKISQKLHETEKFLGRGGGGEGGGERAVRRGRPPLDPPLGTWALKSVWIWTSNPTASYAVFSAVTSALDPGISELTLLTMTA